MKIIDALLMRHPPQTNPTFVAATSGQPVPVAYASEPRSDLESGSDVNQAAVGAWPRLLDGGHKFWNGGWRKSVLQQVAAFTRPGNYGMVTSQANFGFNYSEFGGIARGGGPIPNPYVAEWNELTPIVWGTRVANPNTQPNTTQQKGPITVQTTPSVWNGAQNASLSKSGVTLL